MTREPVASDARRIDLVIFDLGGVLVRICKGIEQAAQRAGIPVPAGQVDPERRAARRAVHNRYELGQITCDEFFELIAATSEGAISADEFRVLHERWIIEEYAGVGGLIDDLHARGLDTGILSNTNASHWRQIVGEPGGHETRFPSARRPRHRHASHLLGLAKPNVEIYRELSRLVGHAPGRTIFFDDLAENVEGARSAGWLSHQIDPRDDTSGQMRACLRSLGVPV